MFAQKELSDLARRKQLLILEADLHRAVLRSKAAQASARLDLACSKLRGNPWLLAGGAAAGLLAARHGRKALKWLPTVLAAWRWVRKLKQD